LDLIVVCIKRSGAKNPGREESQQFIKKNTEKCVRDTTFGCHWENIERLKGKENLALYRATNLLLTVEI
jgi:hypothetical protein